MSSTCVALLIVAVLVTLFFDYTNGFHDTANIIATMVSSRAMSPRSALLIAGVFEFLGPALGGTAVADTIGRLADLRWVNEVDAVLVVLGTVIGAVFWNLITWRWGIPSSSSHALVGSLIGAVGTGVGLSRIHWGMVAYREGMGFHITGIAKVIATLFVSPLVGALLGYLIYKVVSLMLRGATRRANLWLKRVQWATSSALAFSHGANDAQKSMGVIVLVLFVMGGLSAPDGGFPGVPLWVKLSCAGAIALGVVSGGWRIIKTVGTGIFRVQPIHGFSSQAASSAIILGAALLGGPVSSTHVVSTTIMGIGVGHRYRAVHWWKVKEILLTWVITMPVSAILGALSYLTVKWLLLLLG